MPALDWQPLVAVTEVLRVTAWGLPLLLLTALSYYLEEYTKFKTRWRILVIATILSFIQPLMVSYEYREIGEIIPLHEAIGNTLLLIAISIGVYTSLTLLRFQRIKIGKTRDVVDILATIGAIVPVMAFLDDRISKVESWNLVVHNLSIALLVLIFLIIGKTLRNYIPKHGNLVYSIVVFASMLLPLNLFMKDYSCISGSACETGGLPLLGIAAQSAGNLLLAMAVFALVREAKIRGILLTPAEERMVNRIPMKYRLKTGFSYLINESDGKKGFEVFNEHIAHRYHGLGITRTKPELIREEYGLRTTPLLWMTTAETEHKSTKPEDLDRLLLIIKDFISNEGELILLIERLDYLVAENGFSKVLDFIYRLNDVIVSSRCILLVSTNLETLSKEQKTQLVQEFKDVGGTEQIVLNEPLYELLEFIFTENNSGKRPSFKRITDRFGVTKTTTRKRVYELIDRHLVRIVEDGKFKLLEVTEHGRDVMKNPVGPRGG